MIASLNAALDQRDTRRDLALVALYLLAGAWAWLVIGVVGPRYANGWFGLDAAAYHAAWLHDLYGPLEPGVRRYLYSPLFAQAIWPLTELPWDVFIVVWTVTAAGIFWWLLRPLPLVWRLPLFVLLCLDEVILGNIRALLALALVLSATRPGWWALPLLTKPATGVGVLYYVFRADWGSLARALAWTGGLAAASFAIAPDLWRSWFQFMTSGDVEPTYGALVFGGRLLLAVAIVAIAARRRRYWMVVLAVAIASPVINIPSELSLLTAIPRLWRVDQARDRAAVPR